MTSTVFIYLMALTLPDNSIELFVYTCTDWSYNMHTSTCPVIFRYERKNKWNCMRSPLRSKCRLITNFCKYPRNRLTKPNFNKTSIVVFAHIEHVTQLFDPHHYLLIKNYHCLQKIRHYHSMLLFLSE